MKVDIPKETLKKVFDWACEAEPDEGDIAADSGDAFEDGFHQGFYRCWHEFVSRSEPEKEIGDK